CFAKNQWEAGLPYLAKGSNAAMKAAVAAEQSGPKSEDQLIAAGDAWWDAAEREAATSPGAGAMHRHAAYFYGRALESARVTGLSRTRLERRIEVAGKIEAPTGSAVAKQQSVLLWRGGKPEEETYKAIAEGRVRAVNKSETVAILSDPATYASYTIIAFSTNKWRELAAEDITEKIQQSLQDFVRNGGDLILFEQFA